MADCNCEMEVESREQQKALWLLLIINALMFIAESGAGIIAGSAALIADSLDMFADAAVYSVGLYAVGKAAAAKARAALLSGIVEILLALLALAEVFRRVIWGADPEPSYMVLVGLVALVANVCCLFILARHKDGEVHMRASWIFSTNDVIANMGVIVGGVLVYLLGNRWPDIIIGTVVGLIVLRGGIRIVKLAHKERSQSAMQIFPEMETDR